MEFENAYATIVTNTVEEFAILQEAISTYNRLRWRSIDKELPEPGTYVLVSFENEGLTMPSIATYEVDEQGSGAFYQDDCDSSYASIGVFVNAWMPLPKPYGEVLKLRNVVKKSIGLVQIDTRYTPDAGLETMVFLCDKDGNIIDGEELDSDHYETVEEAKIGHAKMIKKWWKN